jgi:hypothetical protein
MVNSSLTSTLSGNCVPRGYVTDCILPTHISVFMDLV